VCARKWSLVVNSNLRVAVGHPVLEVGGLKEAPRAPFREHATPFNTAGVVKRNDPRRIMTGGHFST
jgi:hypothetical protein